MKISWNNSQYILNQGTLTSTFPTISLGVSAVFQEDLVLFVLRPLKQTLDGGTLKVIELSEMLSLLLLHFFIFVAVDETDI